MMGERLLDAMPIESGRLTMLAGPWGVGKGWVLLQMGMALATGQPWLGVHPSRRARVLYLTAHDNKDCIRHRMHAVGRAMGLSNGCLRDNLSVVSVWQSLAQAEPDPLQRYLWTQGAPTRYGQDIARDAGRWDVVILDPVRTLCPIDDREDSQILDVANWLRSVARCGPALVITHAEESMRDRLVYASKRWIHAMDSVVGMDADRLFCIKGRGSSVAISQRESDGVFVAREAGL